MSPPGARISTLPTPTSPQAPAVLTDEDFRLSQATGWVDPTWFFSRAQVGQVQQLDAVVFTGGDGVGDGGMNEGHLGLARLAGHCLQPLSGADFFVRALAVDDVVREDGAVKSQVVGQAPHLGPVVEPADMRPYMVAPARVRAVGGARGVPKGSASEPSPRE